jgi:hypothetical protein
MFQLQEVHAQFERDLHAVNIDHERTRMQQRKNFDDEHNRALLAEASSSHWQQRYDITNNLLLAEQQQRQKLHQDIESERQRTATELWKLGCSETQLKSQLAANVQRLEELTRALDGERTSNSQQVTELNAAHASEILQMKKALAETQGARSELLRELEAQQERHQKVLQDHDFEKSVSAAAIESLQSNVDMLQKQLQVLFLYCRCMMLTSTSSSSSHFLPFQVAQEAAASTASRIRDEHSKRFEMMSNRCRCDRYDNGGLLLIC